MAASEAIFECVGFFLSCEEEKSVCAHVRRACDLRAGVRGGVPGDVRARVPALSQRGERRA